ncbi:MAG: DUF308 domain-containing protein [Propionibacteriaceae bacterium]|nr:DUF308 domain-containing protein [Propionibacteriaceae bacterium]
MPAASGESIAKRLWWLTLLRGVVSVALGLVAIFVPNLTVQGFFILFGVFSIIDGVVALGTGLLFRRTSWGWTLFQGSAGVVIGLIAVFRPNLVAAVIVVFLALWALVIGLFQVAMAWQLRGQGQRSWLWVLISGSVTSLLGLYFLINPDAGAAFLAVTVGIFVLVIGIVMIFGALQLRRRPEELLVLMS